MIPRTLRRFISDLRPATDSKKLKWQEGAPDAYFCIRRDTTLHIAPSFDDDSGEASYFFKIVTGGKVTTFSSNHYEEDFAELRDLYSSIMVNANDVEDDLKNFFDPE
jgi:hypothetical protein